MKSLEELYQAATQLTDKDKGKALKLVNDALGILENGVRGLKVNNDVLKDQLETLRTEISMVSDLPDLKTKMSGLAQAMTTISDYYNHNGIGDSFAIRGLTNQINTTTQDISDRMSASNTLKAYISPTIEKTKNWLGQEKEKVTGPPKLMIPAEMEQVLQDYKDLTAHFKGLKYDNDYGIKKAIKDFTRVERKAETDISKVMIQMSRQGQHSEASFGKGKKDIEKICAGLTDTAVKTNSVLRTSMAAIEKQSNVSSPSESASSYQMIYAALKKVKPEIKIQTSNVKEDTVNTPSPTRDSHSSLQESGSPSVSSAESAESSQEEKSGLRNR